VLETGGLSGGRSTIRTYDPPIKCQQVNPAQALRIQGLFPASAIGDHLSLSARDVVNESHIAMG
jgi:hypothetical protein